MRNLTKTSKKDSQVAPVLPSLDKKSVAAFLKDNPRFKLQQFNFLDQKKVKALSWGKQDPDKLLPQLKGLQRLVRLTHDVDTAQVLYEQGLHAAVQIAAIPEHKFVEQYAQHFTPNGLSSKAQAKKVHQRALASKSQAVLTYTAIAQHMAAHYRSTRFDNLSDATDTNYSNLPSYQDLFGDLDFCSCPECRSIYSPAAYFVDLMRLQANYIEKDPTAKEPTYSLQERRPDLWEIPLDCDHTNTLVPRLQIVNEVLLRNLGKNATYQDLVKKTYPFCLPFHLPLTQIQQYLGKNQQSLPSLWRALLPDSLSSLTKPADSVQTALACATLHLSQEQWTLYSTPETQPKKLAALYGLDLDSQQQLIKQLSFVDTFLTQTSLNHDQLRELLYEDLSDGKNGEVQQGLNAAFFINVGPEKPIGLETDPDGHDRLTNLTLARLDHINRFVRLAQAINWTFTDLDWALRTIGTIVNTESNQAPVINQAALSYLAWVYTLLQEHQLAVNQVCALLGTIKDFGQKNGPTFFDQIFKNAYVLNPPIWKDQAGKYSLVWNVPKDGDLDQPTKEDVTIQNALAAALQLGQDELVLIANQVVKQVPQKLNKGVQLPLTLEYLSILYRLSQLPALTGLSIQECFIALQLPGQPEQALQQLVSASGKDLQSGLELLMQFAQWLKTTPFSVYQLELMLTGTSYDPTIQNQLLGTDKVVNFLNELHTAIQPTLLTPEQFHTGLFPALQRFFGDQAEGLPIRIWQKLQEVGCLNGQGIITELGATITNEQVIEILEKMLKDTLLPILPVPVDTVMWDELAGLIVSTLQNRYQLQQATLTQQLASLYDISPQLVHALELWGGLLLGDLEASQIVDLIRPIPDAAVPLLQHLLPKSAKKWTKARILSTAGEGIVQRLQLLQQYAILLDTLALSAAEVQAMVEHPAYFGIGYVKGQASFTLANIQVLYQFKKLVKYFQDTENHLLDYFQAASLAKTLDQVAQQLSQVTQWDVSQILFLLKKLWPPTQRKAITPLSPGYATVTGVHQLQAYFELAKQLNIDIPTLWQLANTLVTTTDYDTYQELADALWGGLRKQYIEQLEELSTLQGKLNEAKRGALLGLVVYQLRTQQGIPLATARDLYEYLLIDVEVSGIVQTSYVKEAISAVQLYVYRCINHLELGIKVHDEIHTWWPWLEYYRVWQANREVFLYPENYIQPELRKQKTPLFTQLENDLQQANLTRKDQVITTFQDYMNDFVEVANLQIISSAIHDQSQVNAQGEVSNQQKLLCFIGQTKQQPYSYYYRTAVLSFTDNGKIRGRYTPTQWNPWYSLGLQFKPVGLVSPVYAFGKWFIFWVEQQQSDSQQSTNGTDNTKSYIAIIQFSYLNFNQTWLTPQALCSVDLPDNIDINKLNEADKLFWDRVYPVFFSSAKTIVVPYGQDDHFRLFNFNEGKLGENISMALRYSSANPLSQGVGPLDQAFNSWQSYQYNSSLDSKAAIIGSLTTWFELKELPAEGQRTPLLGSTLSINHSGQLCLNDIATNALPISNIAANEAPAYARFNAQGYIAWVDGKHAIYYGILDESNQLQQTWITQDFSPHTPSLVVWNNKLCIIWAANDDGHELYYGELNNTEHIQNTQKLWSLDESTKRAKLVTSLYAPSLVIWNKNLYIFWMDGADDKTPHYLAYGEVVANKEKVQVLNPTNTQDSSIDIPGAAILNDKVYITFRSADNSRNLYLSWLEVKDGKIRYESGKPIQHEQSDHAPSLAAWNDQLYMGWTGTNKQLNYGVLDIAALSIVRKQTLAGRESNLSPRWFFNNGLLFLAWNQPGDGLVYLYQASTIQPGQWNHLVTQQQPITIKLSTNILGAPVYARSKSGKPYIAWTSEKNNLCYGELDGDTVNIRTLHDTSELAPSIAVWNGKLYIAYRGRSPHKLYYGELDGKNHSNDIGKNLEVASTYSPSLAVWNSKIYIAWVDGKQLYYGNPNDENLASSRILLRNDASSAAPSIVAWNSKLYIAWTGTDGHLNYGELNGDSVNKQTLDGDTSKLAPSIAVWNNKLYIAWIGTDGHLNYGELDGSNTVKNKQVLTWTKSNSSPSWLVGNSSLGLSWVTDSNEVMLLPSADSYLPWWYLNGQPIASIPLGSIQNPLTLGTNGQATFTGQFQETLSVNQALTGADVQALYENSKAQVTRDFDIVIPVDQAFSGPVSRIPIVGQPNSYLVNYQDAEFLAWPYQSSVPKGKVQSLQAILACYRLNTTAVKALSQLLLQEGVDSLLTIPAQRIEEISFANLGPNTTYISKPTWPSNTIDFLNSAMSGYYWEVFFHAPFLVAHALQTQQQFEVAKKWYEYIFNPTIAKKDWDLKATINPNNPYWQVLEHPNDKYWRFLGLRSQYNPILRKELDEPWEEEVQDDVKDAGQLAAYHDDPFDPHAIAQLRPIAYQKVIVMNYIDNLIGRGDQLFRRYTMETILEATMLYVMAYDLLGKQPINLGDCPLPDPETLADIAKNYGGDLGKISEFLIHVEQSQTKTLVIRNITDTPHNYIPGDYFGLPENEQFMGYWDTVQQRLYNIRHNLNIDGVYQKLALFEPRINPMQLVASVAAGAGIGQALAGSQINVPYYRFNVMVAKAQAVTQTVIQLGQALLSVLEKKDAEQLSLLYNSNQQNLLALTRTSKQDQLEAAVQSVQSLQASLKNAQDRLSHYSQLISRGLSAGEVTQLSLESTSIISAILGQPIKGSSVAAYLLPTVFGLSNGGSDPGDSVNAGAEFFQSLSRIISQSANLSGIIASYQRREEDWELQQTLAQDDVEQIQYQIVAAQYQERVAKEEIKLLEKQISQEQAVEAFLKNKFTRVQLYQWMVGKLSALYFQAYQLAYNVSLQTERAWQFERGKDQTFIHPTYWDDLYQGLVAGEALQLDLQRMEKAYMDQDVRKLEISKTISLAQLDPQALQILKSTGGCTFDLSERDFDYDYPGHYCRQIRSVSITLPALLGPYQDLHATLTQTANKTLLQADEQGVKYLLGINQEKPDDNTLRVDMVANQQVALSQGMNDSGLFVLNFEDARYLPFEGTGAISSWQLAMPKDFNPIDFESITDVIIRLQYTALVGGKAFQETVKRSLGKFNGYRPLIIKQDYASAWYGFIQQGKPLQFTVSPGLFRPNLKEYKVTDITIVVIPTATGEQVVKLPTLTLTYGKEKAKDFVLRKDNTAWGGITATQSKLNIAVDSVSQWQITVKSNPELMTSANASNMLMILGYTADFS